MSRISFVAREHDERNLMYWGVTEKDAGRKVAWRNVVDKRVEVMQQERFHRNSQPLMLWTIGSPENGQLPTEEEIQRFREMIGTIQVNSNVSIEMINE